MKRMILAIFLCALIIEGAAMQREGLDKRKWTKIQYLGGALGVRGKSMTWNNVLIVSPEAIQLSCKDQVFFQIDPKRVTAISYERQKYFTPTQIAGATGGAAGQAGAQAATVGTAAASAAGAAVTIPIMLALMNTTEHYIAIEYTLPDGRPSGVLLRAHKDNFKEITSALRSVTGIIEPPLAATEPKNREPKKN